MCNHISSCKPQSTKLSWLICTHSAFLSFQWTFPFPPDCAQAFHACLQAPMAFLFPAMLFFIFFSPCSLCHLHSSVSLGFSYACSSCALAGNSCSKDSCESKECNIQGLLIAFWECRKCQIASNHSPASLHAQEELCFALNYEYFSGFSTLLCFYSQGKCLSSLNVQTTDRGAEHSTVTLPEHFCPASPQLLPHTK